MNLPHPGPITVREVGTRDGIQSLGAFIETTQKVELIDALSETGLRRIEATSFVNPRAVPQMADAADVMARVRRRPGGRYEALVPKGGGGRARWGGRPGVPFGALGPNVRGAQDALAAKMDAVTVVVMASEAFNSKN